MELPQSRLFEVEGRKKPTHDFLSACTNSTVHPDPMPSSQGGYLKTQDFLQPLERVGTGACPKEGVRGSVNTTSELKSSNVQNQHVLPGGIGTYTISHIPNYLYHNHHQKVLKSEVSPMFTVSQAKSNERNAEEEISISNCSSYAANNGFTLWDESVEKKGHKRKEIARESANIRDATGTVGQWQGIEQRSSFSSRSSLQTSGVKSQSQSFMDMIKSAKGRSQEDDDDDGDGDFPTKKGNNTSTTSQCQIVDLKVKVDMKGHGNEKKPNTPRSKHSATEQRRRSKINDRFQMLRQLIPNSDQKRDKASFLLEVIEYIHFLQEKVDKHEVVPYQGKLMNWRNHEQPPEGTVPVLAETEAVDMDHQQCLNRAIETTSFPMLGQRNSFFSPESSQICPVSSSDAAAAMESEIPREEGEEEELSVHGGTISISSVYSQGLLKTLTETLQRSGVDLSKSSISVQIKLSKQPQQDEDVHRMVRPRSPSGDENHNDDDNTNIKQIRKPKKSKKTTESETRTNFSFYPF